MSDPKIDSLDNLSFAVRFIDIYHLNNYGPIGCVFHLRTSYLNIFCTLLSHENDVAPIFTRRLSAVADLEAKGKALVPMVNGEPNFALSDTVCSLAFKQFQISKRAAAQLSNALTFLQLSGDAGKYVAENEINSTSDYQTLDIEP